MPCKSSTEPKVKRGWPTAGSMPTLASASPMNSEAKPLTGSEGGDEHGAGQAQAGEPEIFERGEFQRHLGQHRRGEHENGDAEQAAHRREGDVAAERQVELSLLAELVALVGIGGRGGRAGHAQHGGGNVAGEDRHRRRRDDGAERRDRVHEKGHRHQQRGRHGRGQPGDGADEQAEQRRQHDGADDVGTNDEHEGLYKDVHRRAPLTSRGRGGRAAAARA